MNEDEKPTKRSGESGDGWVTLGSFWSSRRVPGIEETQEPTYVAPKETIPRRTLLVGTAIVLASIAIGTALVFAAGSDGDSKASDSELSAAATLTSSSTVSSTTTTTAPPTTSTSSTAGVTPSTTRAATTGGAATPVTTPATPRATANPALPPFQAVPLPAGVTATLTAGSCRWAGGSLAASGTITSTSAVGRTWNMTMHWLQGGRELAGVSGLMDLQPGESKPWSLTISQPNPPADLACSLEVAVP
jgi:hypothetical protein